MTSAPLSISLKKADQSISFTPLGGKTYGDPAFTVSATATSNIAASFSGSGNCTVSGSTVTITGAGSCAVTATQGGNASFYNAAVSVAQGFAIGKHAASATAGSGTMLFGSAMPPLPCTVSGLLAADVGSVTCSTGVPPLPSFGSYPTTPNITPASPANYAVQAVNGTLTVTAYVQQNCFAAPIRGGATPPAMPGVDKGRTVTVGCRLVTTAGVPIATAKGDLLVMDKGPNGLGTPPGAPAFSGKNVFTVSPLDAGGYDAQDGVYSYRLSTSGSGFIAGHYYLVTATWSDGSTTNGWLYLRPAGGDR